MTISHFKLRELFSNFWEKKGHKEVPPISLVPQNDPTTLFTSAGMQPLVPYFLGETHHLGRRLYNIQRCFRSQDIEEVGDNRHTTFFEMMGNWSFGDYFKKDQLNWFFDFLVEILKLDPKKLYVSVFSGEADVPKDEESILIWQDIFNKYDIEAKIGERIFLYDSSCNWWSRSGAPKEMPAGEPGGPDSEVFYDFGLPVHKDCHPNCQCGRFMEIGNSVFMEYKKVPDGTFSKLPKKSVDFGGGLERIMAVINNEPNIFKSEIFLKLNLQIKDQLSKINETIENRVRIFLDHSRASIFLIMDDVFPGKNESEYVLRRLIRRADDQLTILFQGDRIKAEEIWRSAFDHYQRVYNGIYNFKEETFEIIKQELDKYQNISKYKIKEQKEAEIIVSNNDVTKGSATFGVIAAKYQTTYGVPVEESLKIAEKVGLNIEIVKQTHLETLNRHRQTSRIGADKRFAGGLADQDEKTVKYHTATHLLHQALFDVLGSEIKQEGSNITIERLRFDFYSARKPTEDEIKKVETVINQKIKQALPVSCKIMPKDEAIKSGAKSFFRDKYPETVKVYSVGDFSKELCNGPHVANTKEVGKITVFKFEKIGSNLYRIYAR